MQGIVTADDKETLSKEEIKLQMEKYMETGRYEGNLGDILPQLAADYLNQPLLVIGIKNCKVTNLSLIKPGGLFGEQNQGKGCLVIAMKQLNHYETLLIASEAKETAMEKYQQWEVMGGVVVSPGEELNDSAGDLWQGATHSQSTEQVRALASIHVSA